MERPLDMDDLRNCPDSFDDIFYCPHHSKRLLYMFAGHPGGHDEVMISLLVRIKLPWTGRVVTRNDLAHSGIERRQLALCSSLQQSPRKSLPQMLLPAATRSSGKPLRQSPHWDQFPRMHAGWALSQRSLPVRRTPLWRTEMARTMRASSIFGAADSGCTPGRYKPLGVWKLQ